MSAVPSGGARRHIELSADEAWRLLTDVTQMPRWSPEVVRSEWLEPWTGPVVGARFFGENRRGRAKWRTTCTVVASEPGRHFRFVVGTPERADTAWDYTFTPAGTGCEIEERFELLRPPGRFARLVTWLLLGVRDREADLEAGIRATLDRFAAAAQTSGAR